MNDRYATCLCCAHAITWFENTSLRFNVGCPKCKMKDAFGPNVFVPDFEGYTMAQVLQQKDSKTEKVKT